MQIESILMLTAALILLGVLASKASDRLGVPALLLFLGIGMLAGSEGPLGIPFDDARLAQSLGVVALAYILFAGGLDTDWRSVRPVLWRGMSLATLGVLLTALIFGAFAHHVLGFSPLQGLLLGSIVSSTDAAAVFAVLRSRSVSLRGRTKPLLELESGSNDPMAVFLTLGFIRLLTEPGVSPWEFIPMFAMNMALGAAFGLAAGYASVQIINHLELETEGLYPVLTLALVALTYGITASLQGNGFLAVYIAGIVMGREAFVHKKSLIRFHDGLAWLMQIAMFLTLGLLVFPSDLVPVAGVAMLCAVFLMFIARPAAVFASLIFFDIPFRQKVLISWVGLRGAVPIILATFPLLAGIPQADVYFNVVFFIVLTSVLLQGTSLTKVARWLHLEAPLAIRRQHPLEFLPTFKTRSELIEATVPPGSPAVGRSLLQLSLPETVLVVLITRGEDIIVPRGTTTLQGGDVVLMLADRDEIDSVRNLIQQSPPGRAEERRGS